MPRDKSVFERVQAEQSQAHETRRVLFRKLEQTLELPVVTYFTSFVFPVSISPDDADVLEGALQTIDLSKGLALVISSPGGDGLAAESIIKVCRSYSRTGKFVALVPGKAKSAATMICLGAERIIMGPTAELGPVDPQLARSNDNQTRWFSVYNIVRSYERLFERAVASDGNLQPYLTATLSLRSSRD